MGKSRKILPLSTRIQRGINARPSNVMAGQQDVNTIGLTIAAEHLQAVEGWYASITQHTSKVKPAPHRQIAELEARIAQLEARLAHPHDDHMEVGRV